MTPFAALRAEHGTLALLMELLVLERQDAEACRGRLEFTGAADHGLIAAGLAAVIDAARDYGCVWPAAIDPAAIEGKVK